MRSHPLSPTHFSRDEKIKTKGLSDWSRDTKGVAQDHWMTSGKSDFVITMTLMILPCLTCKHEMLKSH